MRGFDGSRFDFHGEHGKSYAIFGRETGDMLTATMRGSENIMKSGVHGTYFNMFGVRVGETGTRVQVGLEKGAEPKQGWIVKVLVDGKLWEKTKKFTGVELRLEKKSGLIGVRTAETDFEFTPSKLLNIRTHHLNVGIRRLAKAKTGDKYVGVLGFTLNRNLGLHVEDELNTAERSEEELEMSLRRRCEVPSLFSKHDVIRLPGAVVRIAETTENVHIDGSTASIVV